MGKKMDLSTLKNKIKHDSKRTPEDRFSIADKTMGIAGIREKVIRRSFAMTSKDVDFIKIIRNKCLDKKIVLKDSHIVRLALMKTAELSADDIIQAAESIPKIATGRPPK